ncbi:hypothetical protein BO71DRAFT_317559 [Aspergillus ellipticus CBS 707.79]|uniref:Zn(2)-C6 fungal-type domain-containing protein n=1 Tax=Aspergillus ellipticus CBS 707.79 TaxID=1448320 RepID=A0A319DKI1_9EURO|nr:hypothetical protein BO71DRAFT_317559 [Aspergillus ellipticus CBS 707.79]
MPRVAPEDRKRVYCPKRRTGCLTCKRIERRVKCSEERPACARCTSTGRLCDGYGDPPSSRPTTSRSNVFPRPLLARPLSIPSYNLFTCDQERRSFHFFLSKTVPQLAGDFECAFWERLLLQSAHHEPAICHVTVALGSLHELFESNPKSPFPLATQTAHKSFALRQYLRALRCLMPAPGSTQPMDVCLISSVLFACFEAMRGQYAPAITHIASGLKILGELRTNPSATLSVGRTPYIPMETLCGLFTRLQGQVITLHRGAARSNIWPQLVIDLDQPIIFNSLADARETLEIYTFYYRQHTTEPSPTPTTPPSTPSPPLNPAAVTLRDTCLILLSRWSTALETFLRDRTTTLTPRERRATALLQLRKIDCVVALDSLQAAGEAEAGNRVQWDEYCSLFEQMVALGESIIESPAREMKQTFSLDLGIIPTMFNVAIRCRDPFIRRRAVNVLRASAVQEGVWNSGVVAAVAEKWIEIEEEGLGEVVSCADVPDSARLADCLPVFDAERPTAVVYFKREAPFYEEYGGVRREVFTW